jgi:trans-aconitate methyltransferase
MTRTNDEIWREYYEKALMRKHAPRTEFAIKCNESDLKVAIDSGCGTGSDTAYMAQLDYQVYSFDINPDSISMCGKRFDNEPRVTLSKASFENYEHPKCGVIIANASLFFADLIQFQSTWNKMVTSLEKGGVFAGDFMGFNDSWASGYRSSITPMTRTEVEALFNNFEVIRFHERDEVGNTAIGKTKHWHTFSVVAIKRS